ncbi:MAG TPA: hypothetical protein VFT47_09185 [Vicinamibacterales bacterium]|nr:hypothetical protein [Vicinamibacterales bacterium]
MTSPGGAGTVDSEAIRTGAPAALPARRPRVDRWFYIGVATFVILLNVAGFGPSLLDESMRNDRPSSLVILHGLVGSAWLLLFLAQATLAATGRTSIHRRLGAVAPALAIVMIVLTFATAIEMVRRGYDLSGDLLRPAAAPGAPVPPVAELDGGLGAFASALNFGILVIAGWWNRRRPQIHKRLMLVALLSLAGVPLLHLAGYMAGQWPSLAGPAAFILPFWGGNLLLFAGAVHDKVTLGRVHPICVWVPLALIAQAILLFILVVPSAPWRQFTAWLASS